MVAARICVDFGRSADRMSGGGYLAVITPSLTDLILAMPSEECDEPVAPAGESGQEPVDARFSASETASNAHLSPSEGVSDGASSPAINCDEVEGQT